MRSSSFITDIVKRHVTLPVNEDLAALKVVLRDWVTYTEHVPLQQKPTYTAELHIDVVRDAPHSAPSNQVREPSQGYWGSFFQKSKPHHGQGGRGATASASSAPQVHRKVVPLELWSAVLPWEVQRGLSLSTLALPSPPTHEASQEQHEQGPAGTSSLAGKTQEAAKGEAERRETQDQKQEQEEEEEEDSLGVVSPPAGTTTPNPPRDGTPDPRAGPAVAVATAPLRPAPGMLFVMDTQSVRNHGGRISFWSGAITQPIDVLFAAPTFAESVGPSTTFDEIRQQRSHDRVRDLYDLPDVQARYFPHGEMQRHSTAELRVANFTHLDPFPHLSRATHAAPASASFGEATHTAEAVTPEARYVIETTRYLLRDRVKEALVESRAAAHDSRVEDEDADVQLKVELSDELKRDIEEKAKLMIQYVQPLEDIIAHHVKRLNTPIHATTDEDPAHQQDAADSDGADRKIRVWLSETESVWMTAKELAARQAEHVRAERETPQEAQRRQYAQDEGDEEEDAMEQAYEAGVEDDAQNMDATAAAAEAAVVATAAAQVTSVSSSATVPSPHAAAVQPVQRLTPDEAAARSIAQQSPMLTAEEEGRPDYLAPSFTRAFSSSAQPGLVVSANKLARYPQTRSDMPVLPPIDYDLFDLTVRLGVGFQVVLFHYHPRIMRDWRRELRTLNRTVRRRLGSDSTPTSVPEESEQLDDKDVMIMLRLVRDPSLQLPEDLITLVEAVADLKEKLHGKVLG